MNKDLPARLRQVADFLTYSANPAVVLIAYPQAIASINEAADALEANTCTFDEARACVPGTRDFTNSPDWDRCCGVTLLNIDKLESLK